MSSPSISREELSHYPQIRLIDSDPENNIDLFSYDTCSPTDPEIVKACRGIVFQNNDIVLQSFPYTYEFTEDENRKEVEDIFASSSPLRFFDAFEGTLIRIFSYNNKWYLSTNRKLDAFKSRWGVKTSYGDYFIEALKHEIIVSSVFREKLGFNEESGEQASTATILDRLFNILNPEKQYMFFLINNFSNRIVCEYDHPKFLHVGTFHQGVLCLEHDNLGFDYPKEHFFESPDELFNYVNNKVDFKLLQGIIIFGENNKQYKVYNKTYLEWLKIRGNEASIRFRYIQLRNNPEKRDLLLQLYPEFRETVFNIEITIREICNHILEAYINRFIRKQHVVLPVEQFIVLSEVHKWYLQDKDNRRVNIMIVIETLNKQNAPTINRMIKKFIFDKNKALATLQQAVEASV